MARPGRARPATPSGSGSGSSSRSRSRSRSSSGSGSRSRSRSRSRSISSSSTPSRSASSRSRSHRLREEVQLDQLGEVVRHRLRLKELHLLRGLHPEVGIYDSISFYFRKASPIPESVVLHIDHLSRNVNEAHLKEIFGNFGDVVNVELSMDRIVNLPRGYGYVEFKKRADAEKALLYMDGGQIDGNVVRVKFTLAQRQKASSPPKVVRLLRKEKLHREIKLFQVLKRMLNRGPGSLLRGGNHFLLHGGDLLLQSAGGLIHRGVDQSPLLDVGQSLLLFVGGQIPLQFDGAKHHLLGEDQHPH
uniref:RRM domain-containing protein n=1 Tax=Ananas comosus var. bracteatus TaxID=296719 RepID=A0A6V7Q1M0_ANACO|nr:unnamed protein product [Ananas comosus var. bracteatus]